MTLIQMNMQFMRIFHIYLEITGKIVEFSQKSKNMRAGIAILCGSSQNMRKNMRSHNRIFPGGLTNLATTYGTGMVGCLPTSHYCNRVDLKPATQSDCTTVDGSDRRTLGI